MADVTTVMADSESAEEGQADVPVFGLDNGQFVVVHAVAVASLAISISVSFSLLVVLLKSSAVSKKPIGERLVVYLAVCDLLYSISHTFDHSYMLVIYYHPPDVACTIFAFFLWEFVLAQALVVIFTALNAFVMVVRQKRVYLGQHDWRLLSVAFGVPASLGVIMAATGHLGQSGMWCFIDMRRSAASYLNLIVGIVMVVTFSFNLCSYMAVWLKISGAQRKLASSSTSSNKYHGTARVMMLFVAVYIAQWWAYIVFIVWSWLTTPHLVSVLSVVIFANLGGLFNFVAYVFVRRNARKTADAKKEITKGAPTTMTT